MEQDVGECGLRFEPDDIEGYEHATLSLGDEDDGELVATLVRKASRSEAERPAVLYLHGFVDYFFQTHLADAVEAAGYRFYALDLRRYGRSLRPKNRANQATSVDDYFEEIDWALEAILSEHPSIAGLIAHSTGALIGAHYLSRGARRLAPSCFIMNSPFFEFNLSWLDELQTRLVSKLAILAPYVPLPQKLSGAYGETIHRSLGGEWDFDERLKPRFGFPLYPAWFRMIREAQGELRKGLELELPILSLMSDKSRRAGKTASKSDFSSDIILNVEHMRELSPRLGSNVTLQTIPGGVHDLTLSRAPVRQHALESIVSFLEKTNKSSKNAPEPNAE